MRIQVMNVNNFFGFKLITRKLWIMKMTFQQYLVYLMLLKTNNLSHKLSLKGVNKFSGSHCVYQRSS